MTKAWEMDIPQGQKMVLLAICDHANDDGVCYPSQEKLAKKCSTTERSVIKHLNWLKEKGIIAKSRRQKGGSRLSNLYEIDLSNYKSQSEDSSCEKYSHENNSPTKVKKTTESGEKSSPSYNKEEPSYNHQYNHQRDRKTKKETRIPDDWIAGEKELMFAKKYGFTPCEAEEMAIMFFNFYSNKTGKGSMWLDWHKTWQNWVIRESKNHKPTKHYGAESNNDADFMSEMMRGCVNG